MSFRRRLTVFFVLIVIVPMISVAFVLFRLIADNESGKADARVAAKQEVAIEIFRGSRAVSQRRLAQVGADTKLARTLQDGDYVTARARAQELLPEQHVLRIQITRDGRTVLDVGQDDAIAPAAVELIGREQRSYGRLTVAVEDADAYVARVKRLTGLHSVVRQGDRVLGSTLGSAGDEQLPRLGHAEFDSNDFRVASFDARGFGVAPVRVSGLSAGDETAAAVARSRLIAAGILLGFFILAFTFAVAVSRSLQQLIAGFLDAARRLGRGDFSTRVPTVGDDEFAALGDEFNKMAGQLESRLEELRLERERVQHSVRRLGQAVASNLDRDALLEIVVETAVEGVAASGGRVTVRRGAGDVLEERTRAGALSGLQDVIREAEADALSSGMPASATHDQTAALAHPLRAPDGPDGIAGVVSVARAGRPFTDGERELFRYLAEQAAVSMENVELHETAARESVTDELTGLFNRRRFDEALSTEVERARRFGQTVGVVLLDLDDFKQVNDTYGHQQGDLVLREVARVLRETCREIDEPARYGGEELAVVLPGTDLDGAHLFAERVRDGIETLGIPLLYGDGELHITASLGVSALPESSGDEEGLVAAADAALYEAKRTGKNRAIRAQPTAARGG